MTAADQACAWVTELLGAASIDDDTLVDACDRVAGDAQTSGRAALMFLLSAITPLAYAAVSQAATDHFDGDITAALRSLREGLSS